MDVHFSHTESLIEEPQFSALKTSTTIHIKNISAKLQQNNIRFLPNSSLPLKNHFSYQNYGWDGATKTLSLLGPHDNQSALKEILSMDSTEKKCSF